MLTAVKGGACWRFDCAGCMLQPASAQRGVLFDVGVMERVMYGSLLHAAHAGAASVGRHAHAAAPGDAAGGGGAGAAGAGPFPAAAPRRQAVRPVSSPLLCAPFGGDEEGARAAGGRTTRDWDSRTLEIRTRYEDLAPQVMQKAGSGVEGAGRGRDGMLDLAALCDVGGDVALGTGRGQSEGRRAGAHVVTGKVRYGRV